MYRTLTLASLAASACFLLVLLSLLYPYHSCRTKFPTFNNDMMTDAASTFNGMAVTKTFNTSSIPGRIVTNVAGNCTAQNTDGGGACMLLAVLKCDELKPCPATKIKDKSCRTSFSVRKAHPRISTSCAYHDSGQKATNRIDSSGISAFSAHTYGQSHLSVQIIQIVN
ncbi:hypothetical protein FIBSPDRAFT_897922 [Athelia psychrophila]|uniref:Uncharacterized protein n=1 Tax=Athelia psychrophila TaxID=1759441 RepID=A0A166BMH5_9AGAM|nr:hypothetical protein FIBSPDRAFT_897922 [Fibularhizoctonia sp. CBS 109695]